MLNTSASRRKASFERGHVPAEYTSCFQGLGVKTPELFSWFMGVEPFLDVAVILICSRLPEGFWLNRQTRERLEMSCLGSWCPGIGRDVCLHIMVFSAPFPWLHQR